MGHGLRNRLTYLLWCMMHRSGADTSCPSCKGRNTRSVQSKHWVSALFECQDCFLRFRVPKDDPTKAQEFYQGAYAQGFTTELPDDATLERLKAERFAGHEKDFSRYVAVFRALGVEPGAKMLDFGTSWGYGAWQFAQAGYDVVASEIGAPRAQFAAQKLGVRIIPDPSAPPAPVDLFFSSHVMEHLPDDHIIWEAAAKAVKPGGVFVAVMPNGDPAFEAAFREQYHRFWGAVHPLMHTARHLKLMAEKHGFVPAVYSDPYDPAILASGQDGGLTGSEICIVARKPA